jgi:membrane protein required for colicin V production
MNSLDYTILIIIGIGFIFGIFKGLIKELASLAAIFLGIYGAKLLSPTVSLLLIDNFKLNEKTALPLAYIIIFIAIVIALLIISKILDKIFESIALGGLNKFLGGLFGAFKYALVISVLINILDPLNERFELIDPETRQNSMVVDPIKKLAPDLWDEAKTVKFSNTKNDVDS